MERRRFKKVYLQLKTNELKESIWNVKNGFKVAQMFDRNNRAFQDNSTNVDRIIECVNLFMYIEKPSQYMNHMRYMEDISRSFNHSQQQDKIEIERLQYLLVNTLPHIQDVTLKNEIIRTINKIFPPNCCPIDQYKVLLQKN